MAAGASRKVLTKPPPLHLIVPNQFESWLKLVFGSYLVTFLAKTIRVEFDLSVWTTVMTRPCSKPKLTKHHSLIPFSLLRLGSGYGQRGARELSIM